MPPPQPLQPDQLVAEVEGRAEPSLKILQAALDLHAAPPLGLVLPKQLDLARDAASDWFWHVHAIAFEPTVRATRRAWRSARSQVGFVGQPGPVRVGYKPEDIGPGASQHELDVTVDLLSLLGIGTQPAEKKAAARLAGLGLGQLEQTVWRAVFAVDRSRVQLATASRREAAVADLLDEARKDLRRLELLHHRDRLGDGPFGRAQAVVADLATTHSELAAAIVVARAALARASGLPPDAPALNGIGAAHLLGLEDRPGEATQAKPRQLLDVLPSLRRAHLAYALAEARLRAAVSEWWPSLRIGPRWKFLPDDILHGGVLALDLPWPGAVSAGIEAAVEARTAAREAVEDALAAAMVAADSRRQELVLAREHLARDIAPREQGSASAWRSARARLWVREGPDIVENWLDALELRAGGLLARLDAIERVRLAELAYREATGRTPGLAPRKGVSGR